MRIPQSRLYIAKNPKFALTSLGRPSLNDGEMTIVYESLQETPERSSLEQLVERCKRRGYESKFSNLKTDIRQSILYQLSRMLVGTTKVPPNTIRVLTPY